MLFYMPDVELIQPIKEPGLVNTKFTKWYIFFLYIGYTNYLVGIPILYTYHRISQGLFSIYFEIISSENNAIIEPNRRENNLENIEERP